MMEPIISIICNTYNQEKYIAEALESFLMQKVSVPIEILVHDDCSTDRTADIIRDYEKKHPEVIRPIYQSENKFSQNISITASIQLPRTRGKYIAFCEGDDYWIDSGKLQKQYDFMEQHTDYSACCHAYNMVDRDGKLIEERRDFFEDCDVPFEKLIGNQLKVPHFATLFVRQQCMQDFTGVFLGLPCNDMVVRIFCATKGKIYYFNKIMSCYRRFTEGSWTVRVGQDKDKMISALQKYIPFLTQLNEYTNGKYVEEILINIDEREFNIALLQNNYRIARCKKAFNSAEPKRKMYILLGCVFPWLVNFIRN